jgi:hypothetical protein
VLGLGLAIVIVLDTRQQLGQRRGRHGFMAFDHEKLDVYRVAVLFSSWVGERLEGSLKNSRPAPPNTWMSERVHHEQHRGRKRKTLTNRPLPLSGHRSRLGARVCGLPRYAGRAKADGSQRSRGRQAASGADRIDALAHDRKPAIASGPHHENEYEHDDDCEPEPESEHEHESCIAEA